MLDFLRHHWYDLGPISFFASVTYFANKRQRLTTTQKWLLASFLAILVHQFEEYRFPGGFPAAMNIGVYGRGNPRPEAYPLNAHSAMITNLIATYGLYLPPVFFSEQVWFGLGPIFLGFGQILIHGININSKMRSFYNPGLASAILLHVPVGVAYIRLVRATGGLTFAQLGLGVAYGLAIGYIILVKYTFTWGVDTSTPYPFSAAEMRRGGVEAWLVHT